MPRAVKSKPTNRVGYARHTRIARESVFPSIMRSSSTLRAPKLRIPRTSGVWFKSTMQNSSVKDEINWTGMPGIGCAASFLQRVQSEWGRQWQCHPACQWQTRRGDLQIHHSIFLQQHRTTSPHDKNQSRMCKHTNHFQDSRKVGIVDRSGDKCAFPFECWDNHRDLARNSRQFRRRNHSFQTVRVCCSGGVHYNSTGSQLFLFRLANAVRQCPVQ